MDYFKNLAELVITAFVAGALGVLTAGEAGDLSDATLWKTAALVGAFAALKGLAARFVGNPDRADLSK